MLTLRGSSGLIVIDEVQRRPDLFPALRVLADRPGVSETPKIPPCWTLILPPSARRRDEGTDEVGSRLRGAWLRDCLGRRGDQAAGGRRKKFTVSASQVPESHARCRLSRIRRCSLWRLEAPRRAS